MARLGVAVAAVASLGMGGGLVVAGAAPAGAAPVAASNAATSLPGLNDLLSTVEGVVCVVLDIVANQPPPYNPGNGLCPA
jgi:hypothetical protein